MFKHTFEINIGDLIKVTSSDWEFDQIAFILSIKELGDFSVILQTNLGPIAADEYQKIEIINDE